MEKTKKKGKDIISKLQQNRYENNNDDSKPNDINNGHPDVFSEEFEIEFMKEMLSEGVYPISKQRQPKKLQSQNDDPLFSKSASELFQMKYIPIL